MAVTLLSLNVKGLNTPYKRSMLWKEARSHQADVLCAQETHIKRDSPIKIRHPNFPHTFLACSDKKKAGVLIAIKDTVQFDLLHSVVDPNGRFIILVCRIDNVISTLVNSYAPNSRQISFLNKLWRRVTRVKQGHLIWCGDFNGIGDAQMDSTSRGLRPPLQLGPWFSKLSLFDAWRCYHASERDYTFHSSVHGSFSRIDFFLVDRNSLQLIDRCDIGTISWSDHAPITLSLRLNQTCPVPYVWRNNTYLLARPETKDMVMLKLKEFFTLNAPSVTDRFILWNAHKAYIRGILIQVSSRWKKERNKQMEDLFHSIKTLEDKVKRSSLPIHNRDLLDARLKLRQHLMFEFEAQIKYSKIKHYNLMNKPSKLMARRVAAARCKTRVPFLYSHARGHKLSHPQAISDEFGEFYSRLYNLKDDAHTTTPTSEAIASFLESVNLPALTTSQLRDFNAPFTEVEIARTIASLPNGKSPGPDGFSNEYFKHYQSTLISPLCDAFNQALTTGTIPAENLQATIVTLPKPGKTPDQPANFRPISLLNSDIKLYAKMLAGRLSSVLPTLINRDQVGFIRGRQAPDGTRRLINIISQLESSKTPAILFSLDAEKAFDRINWQFMFRVLEKFGFVGNIHSAIAALYSTPSARVLVNGTLSKPFSISNGTRQGCPLSPLIFDMVMEPLAEAIRSHSGISGVNIADIQHKISLFADDVILTLTDVEHSLPNVTSLLNLYGSLTY